MLRGKSIAVTVMTRVGVAWLAVVAAVSAAGSLPARPGVTRIYVDPFVVQPASDGLRAAVIAQLRKVHSIALVADPASADASLSGRSEIWIKGYQSLNPRSGRLPSNGTPVYAGFLSVELTDRQGGTLWSYLVTENSTDDIYRRLAKQIAKHLTEALQSRGAP
jgi:hypothetical protein